MSQRQKPPKFKETDAAAPGWVHSFFAVRAPRRGSAKVAQGKAAACRADFPRRSIRAKAGARRRREAAALGKKPPNPTSLFFHSGLARHWRAKPEWKKREEITLGPQPRAARRLPRAILISSLRDFSLARSARMGGRGADTGHSAGRKEARVWRAVAGGVGGAADP